MHKQGKLKVLSGMISGLLLVSLCSVTVYADDTQAHIYAENGQEVEHTGDITYRNISNDFAVGANTGGQVTVDGNVDYTSRNNHVGAAVLAENTTDATPSTKIVITGNVESTDTDVVVAQDNAIVEIGGDVTADVYSSDKAIVASDNSSVKVTGNVTGCEAAMLYPTVIASDSASVDIGANIIGSAQIVGGTVTVGGSINSGVMMYVSGSGQDQGSVVAGDSIRNIIILTDDTSVTQVSPQIVAYEIENPQVIVGTIAGDETPEYEETIANSVLNAIQYIIHIQGDECYTMEGTGEATGYGGVRYKTMTKPSSITITVDSEHYLEGNQAVTVTVDPDNPGRYIVTLNTYEGGIDLQVIRKAIEDATDGDVEIEIRDPSKEKDLDLSGSGSGGIDLTKAAILRDIKNTPSGGVLRIKADRIACFDREMLEAFAARGDIDIELTFPYNGKTIRVFIPRGTDIEKLLDEKGYCGYLRLIAILGFEEL